MDPFVGLTAFLQGWSDAEKIKKDYRDRHAAYEAAKKDVEAMFTFSPPKKEEITEDAEFEVLSDQKLLPEQSTSNDKEHCASKDF